MLATDILMDERSIIWLPKLHIGERAMFICLVQELLYMEENHFICVKVIFVYKVGAISPPPSHRQEVMSVGDSLETLLTQC